jgi:glycosyltransferase involved in cell wall biosynthesis
VVVIVLPTSITCSVFINHFDPDVFYRRQRTRNDDKFIVLFPGTFHCHQGIDLAVEALAGVRQRVPNAGFHIYGDGTERPKLVRLTEQLVLTESSGFSDIYRSNQWRKC